MEQRVALPLLGLPLLSDGRMGGERALAQTE